MKTKRLFAVALISLLASASFFGCNSDTPASSSGSSSEGSSTAGTSSGSLLTDGDFVNIDMSEEVELVISVFGSTTPADLEMINEEVSKLTKEKINCTVSLQIMANPQQQYSLVLSTGEPIDLIWSATWNNCWNYCKQGAYLDITDMVNNQFPELKEMIGADRWDSISVNGSYYLIPTNNSEEISNWAQWGVVWREDLRKAMGCEEITDIESMEAYAQAILENQSGMIPFYDSPSGGLWHTMLESEHIYTEFGGPTNTLCLNLDTKEIEDYITLDCVREFAERQRRWVTNGYVQPDISSSTDTGPSGVLSGKYTGSMDVGLSTFVSSYLAPISAAHPDWELGYMNYGVMFDYAYENSPAMNGVAIPKAAPNPERALAFLELLMTDDDVYRLYDCGIEGTHYEVDENGYYHSLQGEAVTYGRENVWLTGYYINKDAKLHTEDDQWALDYVENEMRPRAVENFWQAFPYDISDYSEYSTACNNILTQYWNPLLTGATDDIDGTFTALEEGMQANGMDVIRESIQEQWDAYAAEKGLE